MRRPAQIGVTVGTLAIILVLGGFAIVGQFRVDRLEGYFAPVFSPDGSQVYFIQRNTVGVSWGLGYEHFTPPAHAYALHDRFALRRLTLAGGTLETLKQWPGSPLARRHLRNYRNRLYGIPKTYLRFAENGELEYEIKVSRIEVPSSIQFRVVRTWNNLLNKMETKDAWTAEYDTFSGYLEDKLRGSRELVAIPGPEYYPSAILVRDHTTGTDEVLLKTGGFDDLYRDGIPERMIRERLDVEHITRLRNMRRDYAESLARFRALGLRDNDARLRTNKEMQRLGYYPKTPTITARLLTGVEAAAPASDGSPLYEIAEREMESGIFEDMRAAVAAPGSAVDKHMGPYVVHHDYKNSARLNAHLAHGGMRFRIRFRGQVYELRIDRP